LVLAKTLGVGEEDVRKQMNKVLSAKGQELSTQPLAPSPNTDILEEFIVELALKGEKISEINLDWFESGFWKKVVEALRKNRNVSELPTELVPKTQDLLLREGEFSEKDWKKANLRLEEQYIRRILAEEQDNKQINKLVTRLGDLTRER
jgi:hypothetical protein